MADDLLEENEQLWEALGAAQKEIDRLKVKLVVLEANAFLDELDSLGDE